MSVAPEFMPAAEADSLHTFDVQVNENGQTSIHATQAPYGPDRMPSYRTSKNTSDFEQMRLGAHFVSENPPVAELLAEQGYHFEYQKQLDGGSIIDVSYPPVATEDAEAAPGTARFIPFEGGSYSARDFLAQLAEGNVMLSTGTDSEENLDWHDNILHRPMWEVVASVPGILPALSVKAGKAVEAFDALPPRDPYTPNEETLDETRTRLRTKDDIGKLMGNIDAEISTGNQIAFGITSGQTEIIAIGLRTIFSHAADPFSGHVSEADENISDEQIQEWATQLARLSGKYHA